MSMIPVNSVLLSLASGATALQPGGAPAEGLTLSAWYALIPLLPLLGFVLCTLTAALRVRSKLPAWLSVVCLGVSFVFTVSMARDVLGGDHGRTAIVHIFDWINFDWRGPPGPAQRFVGGFSFFLHPL